MHNFAKLKTSEFIDLETPYDLESIMHYPEKNDHAIDRNKVTIKPKKKGSRINPKSDKLSNIDAIEIRKLYKCKSKTNIQSNIFMPFD